MKKKLLLLSIIIFPSLIYFLFELTQANFKKMPFFGPKSVDAKGDTVYWSVPNTIFLNDVKIVTHTSLIKREAADTRFNTDSIEVEVSSLECDSLLIDTAKYPVYLIIFIDGKLRSEGYKLAGIYDYVKYKLKDLKDIPVFFISDMTGAMAGYKDGIELKGDFDSLKLKVPNFYSLVADFGKSGRSNWLLNTYFKGKPIYVFDYFMVLVDKKRHIRGYYDPSYNAEVKRMIDEYKHLKIRDGYAETLKQNEIKQDK